LPGTLDRLPRGTRTIDSGSIADRCLIAIPARLVRHAGTLILRLPPGCGLLVDVLTRLRALLALPLTTAFGP
jgi:hypothetical protein